MPASPNKSKSGSADWTDDHTKEIVRAIIALSLAHRRDLYMLPALLEVNGHGGNRISQKLLQVLQRLERAEGVEGAVKGAQGAGGGAGGQGSPRKRKAGVKVEGGERGVGGVGKKVKRELGDGEDEDDDDAGDRARVKEETVKRERK